MFKFIAFGAAMALGVAMAPAAKAQSFGNLGPPEGVYFGSGNTDGNFTITGDTAAGDVQLGLRADVRFIGPANSDGVNTYYVPAGPGTSPQLAQWDFVYSIYDNTTGAPNSLSLGTATLSIADLTTSTTLVLNGNPLDALLGNNVSSDFLGNQNAENLGFGFISNGLFDPSANDTYQITLNYTAGGGQQPQYSDTIYINAVPEPASMALLGAGLAGLGMIRRRRRG